MYRYVISNRGEVLEAPIMSQAGAIPLTCNDEHYRTVFLAAVLAVIVFLLLLVIYLVTVEPNSAADPETDRAVYNGRVFVEAVLECDSFLADGIELTSGGNV